MNTSEIPVILSCKQRKEERNRAIHRDFIAYREANPNTPKTAILTALAAKYELSQGAIFAIAKTWKTA